MNKNKNPDLTKVIRYKCKWCGMEFHTDYLHNCKYSPDRKNCFSCKHNRGQFFDTQENENFFDCDKYNDIDDIENNALTIEEIQNNNWNGGCPMYELRDDYEGKKTAQKIQNQYGYRRF